LGYIGLFFWLRSLAYQRVSLPHNRFCPVGFIEVWCKLGISSRPQSCHNGKKGLRGGVLPAVNPLPNLFRRLGVDSVNAFFLTMRAADNGILTVKTSWFWLWFFSVSQMNPVPPIAANAGR
jgi:hypothetical protein